MQLPAFCFGTFNSTSMSNPRIYPRLLINIFKYLWTNNFARCSIIRYLFIKSTQAPKSDSKKGVCVVGVTSNLKLFLFMYVTRPKQFKMIVLVSFSYSLVSLLSVKNN